MEKLPPMDGNVNLASHVVVLGAGASIAAYNAWGKTGKALPSMQSLPDLIRFRSEIEKAGFDTATLSFEEIYDQLASTGSNESLRIDIENRVNSYFSSLELPEKPTIYDFLILGLREKDIIATFNWDPFLLQAYMRNENIAQHRRPQIVFLHGNVMLGVCNKDKILGINGRVCMKCKRPLSAVRLLYPVKHKDYTSDVVISDQWKQTKHYMRHGYYLTIFGYSAPKTDIEARKLMLEEWKSNETRTFNQLEIIDIRDEDELLDSWSDFSFSHHYDICETFTSSSIFMHPRRSCDAHSSAVIMCRPWKTNPFPEFDHLHDLQNWIRPLIEEEERYSTNRIHFSENPC